MPRKSEVFLEFLARSRFDRVTSTGGDSDISSRPNLFWVAMFFLSFITNHLFRMGGQKRNTRKSKATETETATMDTAACNAACGSCVDDLNVPGPADGIVIAGNDPDDADVPVVLRV